MTLTATQIEALAPLYERGAKALTSRNVAEMGRAALMLQMALSEHGLTIEDGLPLAEEALLRNGNHRYQYAPEPEYHPTYREELEEFECQLTDADYIAGWGCTRDEVIGEPWYPDYMSTWDYNDYEYQQDLAMN